MNILQVQNTLKDLSDGQLQKQMLNPDGSAPSFLVLSELQRRKDLRAGFAQQQTSGKSMAEEYAKGVGGADVGNYSPAMRAATNPQMSPDMDANPDQPMMGESPLQTQGQTAGPPPGAQGYAAGGVVKLAGGGFLDQMLEGFKRGGAMSLTGTPNTNQSMMPMGMPGQQTRSRTYLGPGTPSPQGIEQLYFSNNAASAPGAPDAGGSTPMGVQSAMMQNPMMAQMMMGGSANGATGNDSGSVGNAGDGTAGGVSGTGGVGGSASSDAGVGGSAAAGTGGDDGGTYAGGGRVMPDMDEENAQTNVPDVPASYLRDTRTMKQKFDDAMRVPSTDMGSAGIKGLGKLPWQDWYDKNQKMVATERAMNDRMFTPEPGKSLGQSISDRMMGRIPPTDVGEAASPFPPPPAPTPGGQGYGGPEPMDMPEGVPGAVSRQGNYGDDNVGQDQSQAPAGPGAGGPLQPGSEGSTGLGSVGGGPTGVRGGGSARINIGGAGLEDYVNQVRGMQQADGYDEMSRRNAEDRAKLAAGRNEDKGMALLAAGLGIAGGTSPYFATNVGQGAQAGIKQWNDANKEMRQAERDIRNAENQITIGKANRDERQLEKGISLYARAQENEQRGMDRQVNAYIRSQDRQETARLKELEIKETAKDREERREESRITHIGTLTQRYDQQASIAATKLAALKASDDPMATPADKAARDARILEAQSEAENAKRQADYYRDMHKGAVVDREIKQGNLTRVTSGEHMRELKKQGKLKSGDKIIRPDGQMGTVD